MITAELQYFHKPASGVVQQFAARNWIEQNKWPDDFTLKEWICDQHIIQLYQVAERGYCNSGCHAGNLIQNVHGRTVCKWTRRPCHSERLSLIVKLFSIVNRKK